MPAARHRCGRPARGIRLSHPRSSSPLSKDPFLSRVLRHSRASGNPGIAKPQRYPRAPLAPRTRGRALDRRGRGANRILAPRLRTLSTWMRRRCDRPRAMNTAPRLWPSLHEHRILFGRRLTAHHTGCAGATDELARTASALGGAHPCACARGVKRSGATDWDSDDSRSRKQGLTGGGKAIAALAPAGLRWQRCPPCVFPIGSGQGYRRDLGHAAASDPVRGRRCWPGRLVGVGRFLDRAGASALGHAKRVVWGGSCAARRAHRGSVE